MDQTKKAQAPPFGQACANVLAGNLSRAVSLSLPGAAPAAAALGCAGGAAAAGDGAFEDVAVHTAHRAAVHKALRTDDDYFHARGIVGFLFHCRFG